MTADAAADADAAALAQVAELLAVPDLPSIPLPGVAPLRKSGPYAFFIDADKPGSYPWSYDGEQQSASGTIGRDATITVTYRCAEVDDRDALTEAQIIAGVQQAAAAVLDGDWFDLSDAWTARRHAVTARVKLREQVRELLAAAADVRAKDCRRYAAGVPDPQARTVALGLINSGFTGTAEQLADATAGILHRAQ